VYLSDVFKDAGLVGILVEFFSDLLTTGIEVYLFELFANLPFVKVPVPIPLVLGPHILPPLTLL
jgi:hypothetical protein